MTLQRKNEVIYVALAFLTAIGQLTWVQLTYNDPQFAEAWTAKQWRIVGSISLVFVLTQTLIAWKAFLHNPNGEEPELPGVPPVVAPPIPPPKAPKADVPTVASTSQGTDATGTTPNP